MTDGPRVHLGATSIAVSRLCLGTNVFGWTATRRDAFAILDAFLEAGGNFIDTADVYPGPGDGRGYAETILGDWMRARRCREDVVVATKVGGVGGLGWRNVTSRLKNSLARLDTDYVDIYYAHKDDAATPLAETLMAFQTLVDRGLVRCIGASNISATRLRESLSISTSAGLARYEVIQPEYNLVVRAGFEGSLSELCRDLGISCVPYRALASGFLTGKYVTGRQLPDTPRASLAKSYLGTRGHSVVRSLSSVAAETGTSPAAVAIAWLTGQATVASAIASARNLSQLTEILPALTLELSVSQISRLSSLLHGAPAGDT